MKDTKIQWTHHTFNPWRGCTKVSAGCANCYAENQMKRIALDSESINAIRDGRKTQIRRLVNPQPDSVHGGEPYWNIGGYRAWRWRGQAIGTPNNLRCPYGRRLIVSDMVLEVVSVRVERLQEISKSDVIAEGFPVDTSPPHDGSRLNSTGRQMLFMYRWDDINGKIAPWSANPFVWVIEIRKTS